MKIKESIPSRIFNSFNILLMIIVVIVTLYPFLYVASASISNPGLVGQGKITFYPQGFSLASYTKVFQDDYIWISYWNTFKYTVAQTVFTLFFTSLTAYPLSKKRLVGGKTILMFIGFTMLFSGGLIPTYLVVKHLGMVNTMWALIIPGSVNTFYLFIMRTFFQGLPEELEDAAIMDGCSALGILYRIVLPLSMPVMVTVGLFTAVAQWNAFFGALIYLSDKDLYPLQIHLRNIVISGTQAAQAEERDKDAIQIALTIKYATIMVATLPILCVYPFIQKYFAQGALIGGIKG